MDFGSINLNHLIKCVEVGEITQRVLALQSLDNLIGLGIIQNRNIIQQIDQMRILVNINRHDFISRGAYVVKLLSGEYSGQVLVGCTDNWDFTNQDLKDTYGAIWLVVFIGIDFSEDESVGIEWEAWIRDVFKNNPVSYSDRYFINENLMRQFVDYTRNYISKNDIKVTFSASPMLEISAFEFSQQTKNQQPPKEKPQNINPFGQQNAFQQPIQQPSFQQPFQQQPFRQMPTQQPIVQPMPQYQNNWQQQPPQYQQRQQPFQQQPPPIQYPQYIPPQQGGNKSPQYQQRQPQYQGNWQQQGVWNGQGAIQPSNKNNEFKGLDWIYEIRNLFGKRKK